MQRAGLGISTLIRSPVEAAREAAIAALAPLEGARPDLALLVVTAAWGRAGAEAAVAAAGPILGSEVIVGASVDGVVGPDVEVFNNPAVAALAVSGVEAEPFLCTDLSGCEEELGERVATGLHGSPQPGDWALVFLDSLGLRTNAALASLRDGLGPGPMVGLGATASAMDSPLLWHAGEVRSQACAGVVLRARRPPTLRVAHGFRFEGALRRVTRSRGLWIQELDGRPALEVYREAVPAGLRKDPEWAGRFALLVGLCAGAEPEPPAEWPRDQLLIRRVSGIDEESGAISVPDPIEPGRHIAFVLRDPEEARRDLADQLSGLAAGPAHFGCYLTCETRGATLFGGHEGEAEQLRRLLPDSPLLGLLGAYQLIAPSAGAVPHLHTHSAVLALHGG